MEEKVCPVDVSVILIAMIKGKFRKMLENELEAFAGIEGNGWIWEEKTFTVVCDLDNSLNFNIMQDESCWAIEIDAYNVDPTLI